MKTYIRHFPTIASFADELVGEQRIHDNSYSMGPSKWNHWCSYEQALKYLNGCWEEGAEMVTKELSKSTPTLQNVKRMSTGIVGYTPCVPNYLQGLPNNMYVNTNRKVPQKLVKVYINIGYSASVTANGILKNNLKCLREVRQLEATGTKVQLYILKGTRSAEGYKQESEAEIFTICVKRFEERLNISKLAFPIFHPAFFRQIYFMWQDINTQLPIKEIYGGRGQSIRDQDYFREVLGLKAEDKIF